MSSNQRWTVSRRSLKCLTGRAARPDSTVIVEPYLRARRWVAPRLCSRSSTWVAWNDSAACGMRNRCGRRFGVLRILQAIGAPGPAKRTPFNSIPVRDEAFDSLGLGARCREVAVLEDAALQDRKPDLDLVHPRCVLGRVHESKSAAMSCIELLPTIVDSVVVDIEVVPDDVNRPFGVATRKLVHEGHERVGASVRDHATEYARRLRVVGGQQHLRSIPNVFVLVADRPIARVDARGVFPPQHLHRLFVYAHDHRILRRAKVESTNPLGLREELGVLALEPLPNPMWPQILEPKDAADFAHADPMTSTLGQRVGKRSVCPDIAKRRRCIVAVGPRTCELHQLAANRDGDQRRSSRPRRILERRYLWRDGEPRPPLAHVARRAAKPASDLLGAEALTSHKHNVRSLNENMWCAIPAYQQLQLTPRASGNLQRRRGWAASHASSTRGVNELFPESRIELPALGTSLHTGVAGRGARWRGWRGISAGGARAASWRRHFCARDAAARRPRSARCA